METFTGVDDCKDKEGWIPMSKILSMTKQDPERIKTGLWMMKKFGLIQGRAGEKELEFRLTKFARLLHLEWKTIKISG